MFNGFARLEKQFVLNYVNKVEKIKRYKSEFLHNA